MNNKQKGILAIILASVFWGLATPVVKVALSSLHPFTFVFLRMILSLIILFPFVQYKLRSQKLKLKDLPLLLLTGLMGTTINIGLFFWGLSKTSVIDTSVIHSTTSIFTVLAAYLFLKEKISKYVLAGIILSFFGTIVIIIQPILETGLFRLENVIGNIMIVGAMLSWVVYTIFNKEIADKYDSVLISYSSFLLCAVSFWPFAYKDILSTSFYANLTLPLIGAIAFETIFATIGAYALFNYGIKTVSASAAGVIQYLIPVIAIIASIIFLGEKITWPFIIGAVLIMAGIFLAETRHKEHPLHKIINI